MSTNKPLIAVVDDDQSVREALADLMQSLGYGVVTFPSGIDFLKASERYSATCLIADVQMPSMTGPELHDRLVAAGVSIPTVLITAYPDEQTRQRALLSGVLCYLVKPFSDADLLACLASVLPADAGRRP